VTGKNSIENIQKYNFHFWGGYYKAEIYREMVAELVQSYKSVGYNVFLKVHFLDSNSDLFPKNLGKLSDEQGDFHQDIFTTENRYQGIWIPSILANYCWTIRRDLPQAIHSRKSSNVIYIYIYIYIYMLSALL
jgi:hypothetical protein